MMGKLTCVFRQQCILIAQRLRNFSQFLRLVAQVACF